MSYIEQREKWLDKQKCASPQEREKLKKAWDDGYLTSTSNWCNKIR